jgi:hypothetical protein
VAKGDRDAEHGEEVRVVYCSVEGVNDPGWGGGDEVIFGLAGRICLLSDEAMSLSIVVSE